MGACVGVFAGSGGKGLCVLWGVCWAGGREAGHPPVETTCLSEAQTWRETKSRLGCWVLDAAGSEAQYLMTLIPEQ